MEDSMLRTTHNKLVIKNNASATSMYDLKRPQIIRTDRHRRKHNMNTTIATQGSWLIVYYKLLSLHKKYFIFISRGSFSLEISSRSWLFLFLFCSFLTKLSGIINFFFLFWLFKITYSILVIIKFNRTFRFSKPRIIFWFLLNVIFLFWLICHLSLYLNYR